MIEGRALLAVPGRSVCPCLNSGGYCWGRLWLDDLGDCFYGLVDQLIVKPRAWLLGAC
nr:MAG TPA: hypothetical protein [Caudoviricetes sp.]